MALLLTILSVLAVWSLLALLVIGLLLIHKSLQSVMLRLEQITMGVRAIERQSQPLRGQWERIPESLTEASGALESAADALLTAGAGLDGAAGRLLPRR